MEEDEYYTIKGIQTSEIKIKASRFLGTASPSNTEEQATQFIQQISQKFYNATHNCFAYQIGCDDTSYTRYTDAGEPAGTAGLPILNVIQGRQLTNVAVVVTRYFGGTKLGKGGLVRAYSECTRLVLDRCTIEKKYLNHELELQFDYNLTGNVMRVISAFNAQINNSIYDQGSKLIISLRKSKIDKFKIDLVEATGGKIVIGENY